jgi:transcriptional regulator with XRE-family HTH domain
MIRRLRTMKGMTQTELADKAGTVQKRISTIESGHPGTKIDIICDILAALDFDIVITERDKREPPDIEELF